ncbi:MAG: hypothetical protein ABSH20_01595 [Tepidisphaeraceae bacterium]|jgi:hypothetical protein
MAVELTGIHIEGQSVWDVDEYELVRVLLALPSLVPADAVLYIEGCCIQDDVKQFLQAYPAPATTKVFPGTIAPVPRIFHMPATPDNLAALARIAEHHQCIEVCDHLHVYVGEVMLLQGYDFMSLSLYLSESFSEPQVAAFCQEIGAKYAQRHLGVG